MNKWLCENKLYTYNMGIEERHTNLMTKLAEI